MIDAAFPLLLAAEDSGAGTLIKILVLLGVAVISAINAAGKRAKAGAAARAREREADGLSDTSVRPEVLDRARIADESPVRPVGRAAGPARGPTARPAAAFAATGASAPPVRRKGLVDDAHVELSTRLPTADDMPGAHSAHDHVHLTEIGADRGTTPKHLGAHPTAAATVGVRRGLSGHALLRANDLKGRDRVRAGILWAEVFAPPRSRARR